MSFTRSSTRSSRPRARRSPIRSGRTSTRSTPASAAGRRVIPAGNLVGQPALVLPNGFGENSLPTAIQFTGRAFSDETLVALGTAVQARTEWHRKRPPV